MEPVRFTKGTVFMQGIAGLFLLASQALLFGNQTAQAAKKTVKAPAKKTVEVLVEVDSQHARYEGYRAMDGDPATMWHTLFQGTSPKPPHQITLDLGKEYELAGFVYVPRVGRGNGTIAQYECFISCDGKDFGQPVVQGTFENKGTKNRTEFPAKVVGRYFRLKALDEVRAQPYTSIAELELLSDGLVFRAKQPPGAAQTAARHPQSSALSAEILAMLNSDDELESQYGSLLNDLSRRDHILGHEPQTFLQDALILPEDRDPADIVLRRTRALFDDLEPGPAADALSDLEAPLDRLAEQVQTVDVADSDQRMRIYRELCELRRRIAFTNPLLNFDQILFAKHHRSTFNHMCDQYYGINSSPGGGLFVLSGAFGPEPSETDLLANSVVENGRLQGKKLATGSFISPDLSFDGRRIAFAYVECDGDTEHRHHTDPSRGHWHEGRCFHIFTVNSDGTELKQLTDGTWNDFDPCWLPNGRIAFITERRGGYLRCGRVCPTYTLFDMADDGSQIDCLSYHETNEWHPSVTHDGRIIYTRWDYVDRHGCTAHLPWITTLDGRDSRAVHGNFAPRELRADMELSIRAVPGSPKFSGIGAPHHGQAYGSLVLVDPRVEDDDQMSPVKRVTPEVDFPETQGGAQIYGTPWPLSEKYYLCVYDPVMAPGAGRQNRPHLQGNYGIYLIDAFGNKEQIYRDPEIACLAPIPFRPRITPPVVPETIARTFSDKPYVTPSEPGREPAEATLSVIDVYRSLRPWPEGTRITSLRVVQVLPMTTPSGNLRPHDTGLRLPTAGDSVNPCRHVLGTAPVEKDGSAHFVVPAHKELFFQALDEKGLAVQSMRSSTYLQESDQVTCSGCHDPRTQTPDVGARTPLAMRRPPSRLEPDVDGSNPFSYPRLVQPVLDKHCVSCHEENAEKAPNLAREPIAKNFYASYNSLTKDFGFWSYGERLRTTPGQFGAKASKLYALLQEGHEDVQLTDEEMHRISLWLDMTSLFYGVYEKEGGEAQLRGEIAHPTLE